MNEVLEQLGLNEKEAKLYLVLIEQGPLSAADLAKHAHETRTNTYMILERLQEMGLVSEDASKVKQFIAAEPQKLQRIVVDKQESLKAVNAQLRAVLPDLSSKYRLAHHKPGVIYREGIDGLRESFEDMTRTGKEILVFASDVTPQNPSAYSVIRKSLEKRKSRGVTSRVLLHEDGRKYDDIEEWPKSRNQNVRFIGESPYEGEVAIYGNKCTFTVYKPQIIVTTVTNDVIAETMRTVFENLWCKAKP